MNSPLIGFLTDIGLSDDAVGLCKGLMLSICPDAVIVDITHMVTPYDIYEGSLYLSSVPVYFPKEITVASFVFPETGGDINCLALRNNKGQIFVAPNNGLLTHVIKSSGIHEVYEISSPDVLQQEIAYTFNGRDIVVSAAAHLARGFQLSDLGKNLDYKDVRLLEIHQPYISEQGVVIGEVSTIDKNFGSVWTNIPFSMLQESGLDYGVELEIHLDSGLVMYSALKRTFTEVAKGKILAYINSRGYLSFGMNQASFVGRYGVHRNSELMVRARLPRVDTGNKS